MDTEIMLALFSFSVVTLFTPGPNNVMLMASGANFGLRRSVPHLLGVAAGFPLMVLPVGLGVMRLFDMFPPALLGLQVASILYLLYLAWKIAHAAPPKDAPASARPLTFVQAAAFQWVNPKAWSMALGAITLYAANRDLAAILWVSGSFLAIGTVSALTWTALGTGVRRWLDQPGRLRVFNWTMAALLVGSVAMVMVR
ncbi:LysE family translocator [Tropicibacter naphthalenivorans]|nr:LysE family translocator [Tropicibacter naphthalenivorans]